MENQQLSRFITYPSIVEKSNNHTVLVVDATAEELARLERFLKVSVENFDVYLYVGSTGDLEWLNHINPLLDYTLVRDNSQVSITNSERYTTEPLDYFEQIELDKKEEHAV